jgi:hypothetical protein
MSEADFIHQPRASLNKLLGERDLFNEGKIYSTDVWGAPVARGGTRVALRLVDLIYATEWTHAQPDALSLPPSLSLSLSLSLFSLLVSSLFSLLSPSLCSTE